MSIIAFVENSKEVELINASVTNDKLLFIALEPDCITKLENEHFRYKIIEDYGSENELMNKVRPFSEEIIENIILKTDIWIKNNIDGFSKNNLSLLLYYKFYLNILFDGVISRIYYLKKTINTVKPKSIYICRNEVEKSKSLIFPWSSNESLWAYCLEILNNENAFSNSISVNIVGYLSKEKIFQKKRHSLFKKMLSPYIRSLLAIIKKGSFLKIWYYIKNQKIIFLKPGYQWVYITKLFEKRDYAIINIYNDQLINPKTTSLCKDYVEIIGIEDLLIYNNTNMGNIVRDKINYLIHIGVNQFLKNYYAALKLLIKYNAKVITFSVVTSPYSWIILEAAKQLGINIFGWGHGASGQAEFTKQMDYELLICDYYFNQGLGSHSTYSNYTKYKFKSIPIGFPSLDVLIRKNKRYTTKAKYQFLYVNTAFYRQDFYFSFFPGISDNLLYKVQLQILDLLCKYNEPSIVKLNLTTQILYQKYLNYNLVFETNMRFTELLTTANAIIIDCPTTILLEALTTCKPIFVLTKFIKLKTNAEILLSKRAVCSQNVTDLIESIEKYYHSGIYKSDIYNKHLAHI